MSKPSFKYVVTRTSEMFVGSEKSYHAIICGELDPFQVISAGYLYVAENEAQFNEWRAKEKPQVFEFFGKSERYGAPNPYRLERINKNLTKEIQNYAEYLEFTKNFDLMNGKAESFQISFEREKKE